MVDINNRNDIFKRLENLKPDAVPVFGKLSPQHMVEHLSGTIMLSNGNCPEKLCVSREEAAELKASIIHSEKDFPMELKAPLMGDEPPELFSPDLQVAIAQLKTELDAFDKYFAENGESKPMNPITGELDKEEWIAFHNKHFTHHFKQYNLL